MKKLKEDFKKHEQRIAHLKKIIDQKTLLLLMFVQDDITKEVFDKYVNHITMRSNNEELDTEEDT